LGEGLWVRRKKKLVKERDSGDDKIAVKIGDRCDSDPC